MTQVGVSLKVWHVMPLSLWVRLKVLGRVLERFWVCKVLGQDRLLGRLLGFRFPAQFVVGEYHLSFLEFFWGLPFFCKSSNFSFEATFTRSSKIRGWLVRLPHGLGGFGGLFPFGCRPTKNGRFHGAKGLVYQRSFQANWLSGMEDNRGKWWDFCGGQFLSQDLTLQKRPGTCVICLGHGWYNFSWKMSNLNEVAFRVYACFIAHDVMWCAMVSSEECPYGFAMVSLWKLVVCAETLLVLRKPKGVTSLKRWCQPKVHGN